MTAFDHLEDELRAGVRRAHASAHAPRQWRRPAALALAASIAMVAAALAATGAIRIGHTHEEPGGLTPRPHVGPGLRAGLAKTLPLRVPDPAGGPPWTLRVFRSSRGASCVQVGQVVRGHFGVFVPPGTLEPLHAWPGGESSLCSGVARNGFPVVRGLQHVRVVGGETDPRRCPGQPQGNCPITSITWLRYGLLGPGAHSVRLLDPSGKTLAFVRTGPRVGGAYLFAIPQPLPSSASANGRGQALLQVPNVSVVATFAGGRTMPVAGRHRSSEPLPGLGVRQRTYAPPPPPRVPVAVHVTDSGRFAVVTVRFAAPTAIRRFDRHYTQTLRGPMGRSCTVSGNGYNTTTRDIARGETVRFTIQRPPGFRENGREGWCPGRFTGRIRYSYPGHDITIGQFAFRIP